MPSQRFRDEKGAIAGQDRDGSNRIREGLKEYFAEFGFDPSLTGSTRGFGRDLLSVRHFSNFLPFSSLLLHSTSQVMSITQMFVPRIDHANSETR